jgi:hypothetical protein
MQIELANGGRTSVEVSGLKATSQEVAEFVTQLQRRYPTLAGTPTSHLEAMTPKYERYRVNFVLAGPATFDPDDVGGILRSLGLVGWSVDASVGER